MTRTLILPGLHDSDPRHWQSRWKARDDGRGEFFSQETLNGRAILVRFVISDITPDSCRFEQAFSDDGILLAALRHGRRSVRNRMDD